MPDYDNAANALFVGTAMHTGAQFGVDAAKSEYRSMRFGYNEGHLIEDYKFDILVPKLQGALPQGQKEFEHAIDTPDFTGFIDLVVKNNDNSVSLYDFKYSNNVQHYLESPQIHLYRFYYELENPGVKIRDIGYIFVPKTFIRQKQAETWPQFCERLTQVLETAEVKYELVEYDVSKVINYWINVKRILEAKEFPKATGRNCTFCEYQQYCLTGNKELLMALPPNQKREITQNTITVKVMLYGAPYTGKTFAANTFPDPIFLNTDGNINSFNAPYISLVDTVQQVELPGGRIQTRVNMAWQQFLDALSDLQSGGHTYKTVVVDLVDDLYEACRRFMCQKLHITHESDDSFKAWEIVRNEFYAAMLRLTNLGLHVILICHEDSSRDLCSPRGEKVTVISPNLPEKVANKLAGMVDATGRVTKKDGYHCIVFSPDVYSGNRMGLPNAIVENSYNGLLSLYNHAVATAAAAAPAAEAPTASAPTAEATAPAADATASSAPTAPTAEAAAETKGSKLSSIRAARAARRSAAAAAAAAAPAVQAESADDDNDDIPF